MGIKLKLFSLTILMLSVHFSFGQHKLSPITCVGVDYRWYPIDIEDVPIGGYSSNGDFYGVEFWQAPSLQLKFGLENHKKWIFSFSSYVRYNHFHWTSGKTATELKYPYGQKQTKNMKFDFVVDAEKKVQIKRSKSSLFFIAGLGLVNVNTRYNVTLQDSLSQGVSDPQHFEGTLMRISPRASVGYQYRKLKFSIDCYVVEGPDLTNLTSLWIGTCLSYEFCVWKSKTK